MAYHKIDWEIISHKFKRVKDCAEEWGISKRRVQIYCDENKKRNTYVDIYAECKDKKIIIDTKYKKFKNTDDFSNADVFQVSTYCLLHKANHAILLYPRWGEEAPEIPQYCLNNGEKNYKIDFKTVNLKYNNLKENLSKIKKELSAILQIA